MKNPFEIIANILSKFGVFKESDSTQYQAISQQVFNEKVTWSRTDDAECPYNATINGSLWVLRLNDFPEEEKYTLLIDKKAVLSFTETPNTWIFEDKIEASHKM